VQSGLSERVHDIAGDRWDIVNTLLTFVINERMVAGSAIVPCSIRGQDANRPNTKYANRSVKPHETR
jgi:hypothetical protein